MYFMLDHMGLFDFINVSEWISGSFPVRLRLSASNDGFVLRGAVEGRGRRSARYLLMACGKVSV